LNIPVSAARAVDPGDAGEVVDACEFVDAGARDGVDVGEVVDAGAGDAVDAIAVGVVPAGATPALFSTMSCRVALPGTTWSAGTAASGNPGISTVKDQVPGARSAKEYIPSLPETTARIPPPSVRMAVTVARATGTFAEFVTSPTMVPAETVTTAA